jgi:hypothetical protein
MIKIPGSNVFNERSAASDQWHDDTNFIATGLRDVGHDLDTLLDAVKSRVGARQDNAWLQMAEILVQNTLGDVERLIVRADALAEHLSLDDQTGAEPEA